jgi:23S rRNA pseudouridine2605 synthase
VTQLVPSARRLYPVGRLDADSTGLLVLTNDGELANRLMHPRYGVARTYRVRVQGKPGEAAMRRLREGVDLDDGMTAPAEVRRLKASQFEITLREGRKRQVRRMFETVGHPVAELERIAFGPLRLRGLAQGDHRRLTPAEIEALRESPA